MLFVSLAISLNRQILQFTFGVNVTNPKPMLGLKSCSLFSWSYWYTVWSAIGIMSSQSVCLSVCYTVYCGIQECDQGGL